MTATDQKSIVLTRDSAIQRVSDACHRCLFQPLGAREILGERGGSHAGKFIWGPKVGKMQHGLNVSERYVRGGNLASVRRSEFGKVVFLPFLHRSVAYADLARVVLTPTGGSAGP